MPQRNFYDQEPPDPLRLSNDTAGIRRRGPRPQRVIFQRLWDLSRGNFPVSRVSLTQ